MKCIFKSTPKLPGLSRLERLLRFSLRLSNLPRAPYSNSMVYAEPFIICYYKATTVRPLWLATEWALFSCNDRALWNFSRLSWVASKSNERVGENNKKDGQKVVQLYFQ